jgi:tetratricopeptide (TPR) repeat protein
MAFVRKKGQQLAIVHGERDPGSGEVIQNTLFTFFSKAEALRALGRGSQDHSHYFQHLLEEEFPAIKFNWEAINKGIIENLEVLPDLAEYREQRLAAKFKDSLHAFTRELTQMDPQTLVSSARLLLEHKEQLEFLRKLISMKIRHIDVREDEYNGDNEFYWRHSMRGSVNGDVEEMASEIYRTGDHEAAIAAFQLLVDSFPDYAEGHNYLGLIHLEGGDLDKAIGHFRQTVVLGRKMFPKRIRKDRYWTDHNTRPYMRGLRNLGLALLRREAYDEALLICETLEKDCHDIIPAASHRADIFLNTRQWSQAEENALKILHIDPMAALVAAFSQFEQAKLPDARQNFLFAALNHPLGTEILLKGRARKPNGFWESRDYNHGIEMRLNLRSYLASRRSSPARAFFSSLLLNPDVSLLREEAITCAEIHAHAHSLDEAKRHAAFTRWRELKSLEFARDVAKALV